MSEKNKKQKKTNKRVLRDNMNNTEYGICITNKIIYSQTMHEDDERRPIFLVKYLTVVNFQICKAEMI